MQLSNLDGRAVLLDGDRAVDVEDASAGRFGADPQALFRDWPAFVDWASDPGRTASLPVDRRRLGPPVPAPRQLFAVGLNYVDHAMEAGFAAPEHPPVFTKFPSCLTGPFATVTVGSPTVDWEVELVVVIGRPAYRIAEEAAWDHVAGVMVGQDLSDRTVQLRGQSPQFSLGKSFPGFGPTGPALVSIDELATPDDLVIGCSLNGATVQSSRTSSMIFGVPELLARLAAVCRLLPGDLIFTGTPGGTNSTRSDPRFLRPGDELVSWIGGVGELHNQMCAPPSEALTTAPALVAAPRT